MADGSKYGGYFALQEGSELIACLQQVETNWRTAAMRRGLFNDWRIIYQQIFAQDERGGSAHQLGYDGPQGQYLRFRLQITRGLIKRQLMLAIGPRPSLTARATNGDYQSLGQVPLAAAAIDYLLKEANTEKRLYQALESDSYFGCGALWPRWDPDAGALVDAEEQATDASGNSITEPVLDPEGYQQQEPVTDPDGNPVADPMTGEPALKPAFKPVIVQTKKRSGGLRIDMKFPWEFVIEPYADESSYCVVFERRILGELKAEFPELADKLCSQTPESSLTNPAMSAMYGWDIGSATDDLAIVKHFYHRRCKAIPNGRYVAYCGDVILWDLESPLERGIPLVEIKTDRYFGTNFGYPAAAELLAPQQVVDATITQISNNAAKFGSVNLWGSDGLEFDQTKMADGGQYFTLKEGQSPPVAIKYEGIPDTAKFLLDFIPQQMNLIAGVNDTVLGQPQASISSGAFAQLMVNLSEKYNGPRQQEYDNALVALGNMCLEMTRSNASRGWMAEVSGESNAVYMKLFNTSDLQSVDRIQIVRQDPNLSTAPGQIAILEALSKFKRDDRAAAIKVMNTQSLDAFTEGDSAAWALIASENQRLLRGEKVTPSKGDNLKLHNPSHQAQLDKLRTIPEPTDPAEKQAYVAAIMALNQHIADHALLWSQTDPALAESLGLPPPPAQPGAPVPGQAAEARAEGIAQGKSDGGGGQPRDLPAPGAEQPGLPDLPDQPANSSSISA